MASVSALKPGLGNVELRKLEKSAEKDPSRSKILDRAEYIRNKIGTKPNSKCIGLRKLKSKDFRASQNLQSATMPFTSEKSFTTVTVTHSSPAMLKSNQNFIMGKEFKNTDLIRNLTIENARSDCDRKCYSRPSQNVRTYKITIDHHSVAHGTIREGTVKTRSKSCHKTDLKIEPENTDTSSTPNQQGDLCNEQQLTDDFSSKTDIERDSITNKCGDFSPKPKESIHVIKSEKNTCDAKSQLNASSTVELMNEGDYALHMQEMLNDLHQILHRAKTLTSKKKNDLRVWKGRSLDAIENLVEQTCKEISEPQLEEMNLRRPCCVQVRKPIKPPSTFTKNPEVSRLLAKKAFTKQEANKLLNQILLLEDCCRLHPKLNRREPISASCPMHYPQDSSLSASGLSGIGDMNSAQLIYSSLHTPRLHTPESIHSTESHACLRASVSFSEQWTESQQSTTSGFPEASEESYWSSSWTENPQRRRRTMKGYFDSFVDVRIFPERYKTYKFHLRTDIVMSLFIVFLFLCLQFFQFTPIF